MRKPQEDEVARQRRRRRRARTMGLHYVAVRETTHTWMCREGNRVYSVVSLLCFCIHAFNSPTITIITPLSLPTSLPLPMCSCIHPLIHNNRPPSKSSLLQRPPPPSPPPTTTTRAGSPWWERCEPRCVCVCVCTCILVWVCMYISHFIGWPPVLFLRVYQPIIGLRLRIPLLVTN